MATPTGVQALIRALRPSFRSLEEKVVFAVHAILASNGLRLVAVGPAAETPGPAAATSSTEEASLEGWNTGSDQLGGCFSFLYAVDAPGQAAGSPPHALLLVKCLPVGGATLLINMLANPSAATAPTAGPLSRPPARPQEARPSTLELEAARYVASPADLAAGGYAHLEELVQCVQAAMGEQVLTPAAMARLPAASGSGAAAASQPKGSQQEQERRQQEQERRQQEQERRRPPQRPEEERDPLRDYSRPGVGPGVGGRGLPEPLRVGQGDLTPGGVGWPGGFGPGGSGGMLVGPQSFPGRGRQPPGVHPSPPGLPPGARWDPIAPEGLQGWSPDDFRRDLQRGPGQGVPDPDIMQPGVGKGADYDAMFG